jgi:Activator of Hsp90 ATPase homolog 1-like protein
VTVTPMHRPPIRQSTTVQAGLVHTFEVFVGALDQWWPLRTHSRGKERVTGVTVERRAGGRVYETWDDGQQRTWGTLLAWNPPSQFVLTWDIVSPGVTEVELRFRELAPSLTRVDLEHRGWDKLTDAELAALSERRDNYERGWAMILRRFTEAASTHTASSS